MEFLNRCSSPTVDVNYKFYYPYGNTLMEDFLEDFLLDDDTNILLLGSGDIRHILKTVGGFFLRSKAGIAPPKFVKFEVTDVDAPIVARNIILLKIIMGMNPVKQEDVDFLWDVWYNKSLLSKHHERLQNVITVLLEEISEASGGNQDLWHLGNSESRTQVETALRAWKFRPQFHEIEYGHRSQLIQSPLLCKDRTEYLTDLNYIEDDGTFLLAKTARDPSSRKRESEVKNPTMFRPYENMFCVPLDVQPWLSYFPLESKTEFSSLYSVATMKLRETIKIFLSELNKTKISITFWTEEALRFCYLTLKPQGQTYQLIHASNLSDYLGLINVLLACQPLLKNDRSVLMTELFRWPYLYPSLEMYLRENVCCDALLLPTLFGLRLAEDFQCGTSSHHTVSQLYEHKPTGVQKIRWVKAFEEKNTIPVELKDSPDVARVLKNLVLLTMESNPLDNLITSESKHTYTPLTMIQILHQLQNRIHGGIPALIQYVDEILNNEVKSKNSHSLMWNMVEKMILSSSLDEEDELLEVEVSFKKLGKEDNDGSNLSSSNGAIYPTRLVLESTQTKISEVISLFTFDKLDSSSSFKFPLLRSQWETLTDQIKIKAVLSDAETGKVCIRSEAVSLKSCGKILQTHHPIKIQNSMTNFMIKSETDVLCTEFLEWYELTVKFKKQCDEKIKIIERFLPDGGPRKNEVILSVSTGATVHEHHWIFSCYLERNKSKFSISNKNGTATAILVKQEILNSGKSLLPFRMINDKLDLKKINHKELASYLEEAKILNSVFCLPIDSEISMITELLHDASKEGSWHLRGFHQELIKTASNGFTYNSILIADKPIPITERRDEIPDGVVMLDQISLHKGLPFLKVTVIDNVMAKSLIERGKLSSKTMQEVNLAILKRALAQPVRPTGLTSFLPFRVRIDAAAHGLFQRYARLNSYRMEQTIATSLNLFDLDDLESKWIFNSYIQLVFPRDKLPNHQEFIQKQLFENDDKKRIKEYSRDTFRKTFPKLFTDSSMDILEYVKELNMRSCMENLIAGNLNKIGDPFTNIPYFPLSSLNQKSEAAENVQSKTNNQSHDRTTNLESSPSTPMTKEGCSNTACKNKTISENLKKCLRCQSVKYCSKHCQVSDWSDHRKVCFESAALPYATQEECSNTACKNTNISSEKLKKCLRCHGVKYCSKSCQISDWNDHRKVCVESPPSTNLAKEDCNYKDCTNPLKSIENLKKCLKCHSVKYCSKPCQISDWDDHRKVCLASPSPASEVRAECSNKTCTNPIKCFENLKKCSKCHSAKYCSKSCQISDWNNHKKICGRNKHYKSKRELTRTTITLV